MEKAVRYWLAALLILVGPRVTASPVGGLKETHFVDDQTNKSPSKVTPVPPPKDRTSIRQESKGDNSPNIVGDNNTVTIVSRERMALNDAKPLTAALGRFAGTRIKIILYNETQDTAEFADKLNTALRNAGLNVVDVAHMQPVGWAPIPGISFWFSGNKDTSNPQLQLANAIVEALASIGVIKGQVTVNQSGVTELAICITPL
jgi:hypothetical protein